MEANCLVFPSPQRFNIQPIIYKIVLIPQNPDEGGHIPYHQYLNLTLQEEDDDFQKTIRRLNSQNMLKTRDQTKYMKGSNLNSALNPNKQANSTKYHQLITRECEKQNYRSADSAVSVSPPSPKLQGNLGDNRVPSDEYIPCLFLPGKKDKIMVFFHANAQDITSSSEFLKMINIETQYSILAMEYRGYSINNGDTNPALINKDANRVIQYLTQRNISQDQIIIFGRSIGCAIALGLVNQQYKFYSLVLLSPFLSLKKIAKQLYGNCAGWALKQGFDNEKNTLNINSPLLLIHGMKDTLVPYEHSLALFSQCKSYCQLKLIETMTHSRFNFRLDFIRHFQMFINELIEADNE